MFSAKPLIRGKRSLSSSQNMDILVSYPGYLDTTSFIYKDTQIPHHRYTRIPDTTSQIYKDTRYHIIDIQGYLDTTSQIYKDTQIPHHGYTRIPRYHIIDIKDTYIDTTSWIYKDTQIPHHEYTWIPRYHIMNIHGYLDTTLFIHKPITLNTHSTLIFKIQITTQLHLLLKYVIEKSE